MRLPIYVHLNIEVSGLTVSVLRMAVNHLRLKIHAAQVLDQSLQQIRSNELTYKAGIRLPDHIFGNIECERLIRDIDAKEEEFEDITKATQEYWDTELYNLGLLLQLLHGEKVTYTYTVTAEYDRDIAADWMVDDGE